MREDGEKAGEIARERCKSNANGWREERKTGNIILGLHAA